MRPIRIFRHIACEPPGYLADYLRRRGVPFEVVCIDEGRPVPMALDDVSGLVLMGGAVSVHDPLGWIAEEIQLVRNAVAAGVPVMGVCLGGQLMAAALGAEVTLQPAMEIGWHPITRTEGVAARDWLSGLPATFMAYHWHAWTFAIPEGAECILASEWTPNQGFVLGPHLAMQFHLEMTDPMVRGWVARYGSDLAAGVPSIQDGPAMTADLPERISVLHRASDVIYGRWLAGVLELEERGERRA